MESGTREGNGRAGHPRLVRCEVENPAGEVSARFVELEQFQLWQYMMRTRHGIEVRARGLGLWFDSLEYFRHAASFGHGGAVEEVTRITLSAFNPLHHYVLDIDRFVPRRDRATVREILLSHLRGSDLAREHLELDERHGVCVLRALEDPALELILGLSTLEVDPTGALQTAAAPAGRA